jgi:hypothetical protein
MPWKLRVTIENGLPVLCMYCQTPIYFNERWGWLHIENFEKVNCNPWARPKDRGCFEEDAPALREGEEREK